MVDLREEVVGPGVFCGDDAWAREDQELAFFTFCSRTGDSLFLKADAKLAADVLAESGGVIFFSTGMELFNSPSLTGLFAAGCITVGNTGFSSFLTT